MVKQFLIGEATGVVTAFSGNGRKLGYPTANIVTKTDLADGVYFGYADLADYQNHPALIFIGVPVSVGDTERRLEAHLLDIADQDYYGQRLNVTIMKFHRPNQKFTNLEQLMDAMKLDEAAGRQWFKEQDK